MGLSVSAAQRLSPGRHPGPPGPAPLCGLNAGNGRRAARACRDLSQRGPAAGGDRRQPVGPPRSERARMGFERMPQPVPETRPPPAGACAAAPATTATALSDGCDGDGSG